MTVQAVSFDNWNPGVPAPAAGQGVDVCMAIQHQAAASAGPFQGGDGLEPPRLHFLKVNFVTSIAEEAG